MANIMCQFLIEDENINRNIVIDFFDLLISCPEWKLTINLALGFATSLLSSWDLVNTLHYAASHVNRDFGNSQK